MENQTTQAVATAKDKGEMEYTPFGSDDPIKLSIAIIQKFVAVPTRSGATCGEGDAIKFMMMCRSRRLNPFEGDAFLIGFDSQDGAKFTLITAHQAFLKRAEVHPEYDGMESGALVRDKEGKLLEVQGDFVDDGLTLVGGWSRVHFKNRKHPMYKKVKLSTFQQAYGRWKIDPAGMIVKCAEADALRSSFPTMMGGMYLREEIDLLPGHTTIDVPKAEATPGPKPPPVEALRKAKTAAPTKAPAQGEDGDLGPVTTNETQRAPQPDGKIIDVTSQVAGNPTKAAATSNVAATAGSQAPKETSATSSAKESSATPASPTSEAAKTVEIPPTKLPEGWLKDVVLDDVKSTTAAINRWLTEDEMTADELIVWCRGRNLLKDGEGLEALSPAKRSAILKKHEMIRGEIIKARG